MFTDRFVLVVTVENLIPRFVEVECIGFGVFPVGVAQIVEVVNSGEAGDRNHPHREDP